MWRDTDLTPDLLAGLMAEEIHRLGRRTVPIILDPISAVQVVAQLQLALHHPENAACGAALSAGLIRKVIEFLRATGYEAHAYLAEMGNAPRSATCAHCGGELASVEEMARHVCSPMTETKQ